MSLNLHNNLFPLLAALVYITCPRSHGLSPIRDLNSGSEFLTLYCLSVYIKSLLPLELLMDISPLATTAYFSKKMAKNGKSGQVMKIKFRTTCLSIYG